MRKPKNSASRAVQSRRRFLQAGLVGAVGVSVLPALAGAREMAAYTPVAPVAPEAGGVELNDLTIADLQAGIASGKFTARSLTDKYLARIEQIDRQGPAVNSVIELNPDALAIAGALDKERKGKGTRGPLHGIPVLIKDNIDTADRMQTTAGSLALLGSRPARDSFVAQKLRAAGAIMLGRGGRGQFLRTSSGHGDGWLGGLPFIRQWNCGDQADPRHDQQGRHCSHRAQSGHRRPDGAHGSRRGDPAQCAGRS